MRVADFAGDRGEAAPRMNAKDAIASTVHAWGGQNPAALMRIAERESAFVPTAVGDIQPATEAYERVWQDLVKMGNPWAQDTERWYGSYGLYQLMAPYYARIWHPQADPHVLFDPHIATAVAARIWNRAVAKGAKDFMDVRMFWANPKFLGKGPGDPFYDSRLDSKFTVVEGIRNPPVNRYDYQAFGTGPQPDQEQKLAAARGGAVAPPKGIPFSTLATLGLLAWKVWKHVRSA